MMNVFVDSVKRLYEEDYIDKDKVLELKKNGKLTIEEINYIFDYQKKL